jgi:hypothetical protein
MGIAPSSTWFPHDQGSDESDAVAKADFDRPYVGNQLTTVVRECRFLLVDFFQLQLDADVIRNTQVYRATIRQRFNLHGCQLRLSRIPKADPCIHQTHVRTLARDCMQRNAIVEEPGSNWQTAARVSCRDVNLSRDRSDAGARSR